MTKMQMRNTLSPRLNALTRIAPKPASYALFCMPLRPLVRPTNLHRRLAQVRPDREVFSEVWFTPSRLCLQRFDTPDAERQATPPDERTLNLGKSESSNLHPGDIVSNPVLQLYASFSHVSHLCLLLLYLRKSCHRMLAFISFPPLIHISPLLLAGSPIMPLCGVLPWLGAACL